MSAVILKYTQEKEDLLKRLLFSEKGHLYTLDGMRIQSVTQVIEPYLPYGGLPADVRDAALQRGTIVHALTELDDLGQLDHEDARLAEAAGLMGYLEAWRAYKKDKRLNMRAVELRVYHSKHRYSGTADRLMESDDMPGIPILGEIKTGSLSPFYALQTAAYVEAIRDGGIDIPYRWIVELKPNGKYHPAEHTNKEDFPAFVGALKMAAWKQRFG